MKFDSSSEFFDSEMVQASLEEIKELQDLITNSIIDTAFSPITGYEEDESEQLDLIEELLEKQKLMYFRCKLSKDEDIVDYFTAIFSQCDDPQRMWIGEIIETGEDKYNDWKKKIQSLNYIFKQEMTELCGNKDFNSLFECKNGKHPIIIKEHLKKNITTETLVILDGMLGYKKDFDDKLDDFVWKTVSMKLDKYKPFLLNNINLAKYKQTLKEIVVK